MPHFAVSGFQQKTLDVFDAFRVFHPGFAKAGQMSDFGDTVLPFADMQFFNAGDFFALESAIFLYSLFEPALLALATGMICYWQYYFLRGQIHEFFLLILAGISGVIIYFPALYFMMFDSADKIRVKKIISKFTGKLKKA